MKKLKIKKKIKIIMLMKVQKNQKNNLNNHKINKNKIKPKINNKKNMEHKVFLNLKEEEKVK